MEIRGFSESTNSNYISHISKLGEYFNRPPHKLAPEHIHDYQVHLVQQKHMSWSSFNGAVCAMRFFLTT